LKIKKQEEIKTNFKIEIFSKKKEKNLKNIGKKDNKESLLIKTFEKVKITVVLLCYLFVNICRYLSEYFAFDEKQKNKFFEPF
jgi:hypothetical protein